MPFALGYFHRFIDSGTVRDFIQIDHLVKSDPEQLPHPAFKFLGILKEWLHLIIKGHFPLQGSVDKLSKEPDIFAADIVFRSSVILMPVIFPAAAIKPSFSIPTTVPGRAFSFKPTFSELHSFTTDPSRVVKATGQGFMPRIWLYISSPVLVQSTCSCSLFIL
ncbi:Uncharacterised protein [Mycobacteroides abscessus subsp. abscessus]|nr:Uncharacterised protein [Mycobacteroides abscessus subsp. abscessus]